MKNSAIFILFLWTVLSFSQEIELKGIILNTDNIDGVHVLNTRAKQFTVTNEKGQFYIAAKANDTLYFNSLVYKDQGFVVSALMIENRTIYVQLEEYVNELQEVLVGRKLTGDINQDIKQVKIKDSLDFPDVGIPGFQGEPEEKIVPVIPAIGIGVVVDVEALYKHASGYYKSLKIGRNWDKQDKTIIKVYDHFGHDFFIESCNVAEGQLYEFLLASVEEEGFVNDFNKGSYELLLHVFDSKKENFQMRD